MGQEVKRLSINNIEKWGHHSFSNILKNLRLLTAFTSQGIKTGQILHSYILSELMAAGIMGISVFNFIYLLDYILLFVTITAKKNASA